MKFTEWLNINENLQIFHINQEDDWEDAEQAYQIAKMVGIRPNRDKEPTIIAKNDKGEVIGAAFTSWSDDHDATQQAGEPIAQWDFDVVVHPHLSGKDMKWLE